MKKNKSYITFENSNPSNKKGRILLYNSLGKIFAIRNIKMALGLNSIEIDDMITELPSGSYNLTLCVDSKNKTYTFAI